MNFMFNGKMFNVSRDITNSDSVVVYTDGSFRNGKEYAGFGVLILPNERYNIKRPVIIKGSTDKEISSRNVAGEIFGAVRAIQYISSQYGNIPIEIRHDYQGVGDWATGKWKANKELTKSYKKFMSEFRVSFTWVKAHSTDKFNGIVDILAKDGIDYPNKTLVDII